MKEEEFCQTSNIQDQRKRNTENWWSVNLYHQKRKKKKGRKKKFNGKVSPGK